MIKFRSIRVKNFRSYKEDTIFMFNNREFNFICGDTGAGKSSIFRALIWVLMGTDSEGVKGTNLKNWSGKGACYVELKFEVDGQKQVLYRQQGPNKLRLNDEEIEQEAINDLFGFNVKLFNYIVFMSQFSDQFIHASATEKLELFTTILELDQWDQYSEEAKQAVKDIKEELDDLEAKINKAQGSIETLKSISYVEDMKNFEEEKKDKIERLKDKATDTLEAIKKSKYYLEAEDREVSKLKLRIKLLDCHDSKISDVQVKIEVATDEIRAHQYRIKDLQRQIDRLESEREENKNLLEERLKNFYELSNTVCSHCNQTVSGAHAKKQIDILQSGHDKSKEKINESIADLLAEISKIQVNSKKAAEELVKLENYKDELIEKLEEVKELEDSLSIKTANIQQTKREVANYEQNLLNYKTNIKSLKESKNPYIKKQDEIAKNLKEAESNLKDLEFEFEEIEQIQKRYEYWIKAFKEIKLAITKESIDEFNFYCNDNLHRLGLIDWKIVNSIDKVLRTGKTKKGFSTVIVTPENDKEMPLAIYSGGEHQRVKLAMVFALIDFLNYRITSNIEVYDEPTQWLNDSGIENLLEILEDRSSRKSVYIIDHRDFKAKGIFDNVYEIVKDKNGSKIKEA